MKCAVCGHERCDHAHWQFKCEVKGCNCTVYSSPDPGSDHLYLCQQSADGSAILRPIIYGGQSWDGVIAAVNVSLPVEFGKFYEITFKEVPVPEGKPDA